MSPFGLFLLAIIFFLITVFIVQVLWNYIMPNVFGVNRISFLQALAIYILASLLFGRVIGLDVVSLINNSSTDSSETTTSRSFIQMF